MWNLSDLSLRERDVLLALSLSHLTTGRTHVDLDPMHEGNFRAASRLAARGIIQMHGFRISFTQKGGEWFEALPSLWDDLGD